jgi:hypothetical protein
MNFYRSKFLKPSIFQKNNFFKNMSLTNSLKELDTIIESVESSLNVKTEKKEVKKKEVKQVLQKKDENDERFEKAFIQVSKIVEAETLNDKLLKLTISKFFILYIF